MNVADFKFKQIAKLVQDGATLPVVCKKEVESLESYAEAHMRARIIRAREDGDDVLVLTLDFTEFDDFNKAFEQANYYDKSGNATLTARQANLYKPHEDYYVHPDYPFSEFFEILSEQQSAFFARFTAEAKPGQPYISWLEEKLTVAEANVANRSQ